MTTTRPSRGPLLRVLLGEAPGLETLLMAAVPAVVVGCAVGIFVSHLAGVVAWAVAMVVGVLVARRFVRPRDGRAGAPPASQGDVVK